MKKLKIIVQEITAELKRAYLDYALSVIISRALPDARDGLKPVQRRIIYVMKELGLWSNEKFTKCANIVGNTIARYHPHGDQAVYDALVRLAQDFSMRYPLVQGQGNFGSIDGDPPAAYRYTEAKLSKMAEEMLADIEKETVDFRPNYDNTREEPVVLPAKVPNLLINGSMGIAVGMATSIPPHNLTEVMTAVKEIIKNEKITTKELLKIIKGPDFPTGGIVYAGSKLEKAYEEGRGGIVVRGEIEIEETKRGKEYLVIKSIPWQVNKAELVKEIATLALDKVIEGIKDVRDESNKEGMRVVIELKPEADYQKIIDDLYRLTSLQKTYYFNFIALENGLQPKNFNLKELLVIWLNHRREVVKRRTRFDLEKNKERVHLLEGFDKALENLDRVIETIKKSKDKKEALENLMKKFKLSEKQADAILEMPLRTLTQMERHKILEELKERKSLIQELEMILRSPKKIDEVIVKEIDEIIEKYSSPRLTKVVYEEPEIKEKEIPDKNFILLISSKNQIFTFEENKTDLEKLVKNKIFPKKLIYLNSKDTLIIVTKNGKVYNLEAYELYNKNQKYLESFIKLESGDEIIEIINLKEKYLSLITKNGLIKKLEKNEVITTRKAGISVIKLSNQDEVVSAFSHRGGEEIFLVLEIGNILIFKDNLSPQGRSAKGVKAAKERIINGGLKNSNKMILVFSKGFVKLFSLEEIKTQNRGGKGVFIFEKEKYGNLILAKTLQEEKEILLSDGEMKAIKIKEIPLVKRVNAPKKISGLDEIKNVFIF
ncbi:DNA gyrase subunit A [bacterium HR35]|nr:DNA gyrase subunit A [bacterium HR35]